MTAVAGAGEHLLAVFDRLHARHGPQHWWPGDTPFEIMVGAILTQNTAWSNVERAIDALDRVGALSPAEIVARPPAEIAQLIRPAGYFNVKAARLRHYCQWYLEAGGFDTLGTVDTAALRQALLAVNGVGPETADDILLYAFERPVFVIDAYTRRLFGRLGLIDAAAGYEALRQWFEAALAGCGRDPVRLFNEYHALIVVHAKEACRKRPLCDRCPLAADCAFG